LGSNATTGKYAMAGIYLIARTNSFERRRRILAADAYVVRQRAIHRGDDFEGWHLSRLMRDAATPFDVTTAEHQYRTWLRASPFRGREVA
jgi:hypothetical protein